MPQRNEPTPLSALVEKYLVVAGDYGKSVAISALGYSREEAEAAFDSLDEDYHISRFFHFRNEPATATGAAGAYDVNGFPQTHVSIDGGIQSIL